MPPLAKERSRAPEDRQLHPMVASSARISHLLISSTISIENPFDASDELLKHLCRRRRLNQGLSAY